jgi:hypothetical protein
MLTWYDEAGEAIVERWTVHFDIPVYNSDTGLEGSYTGNFVRRFDWAAGTSEILGSYRKLQIDGRNVLSAAGHQEFDEINGLVLHSSGHGDLDAFFEPWCDLFD